MAVRVFHADDNAAYRELIALVLDGDGVEVVGGAADLDDAVAGVAATRPDVVLLDQLGGAEVVERLRAAAPGARVVVLSGFPRELGDLGLAAAADAYLEKSPDIDELRRAVLAIAGR